MIPTVGRDCLVQQFPAEVARPVDPLAEIVSGLVGPNLSFDGAADGGATLVRVSPSPWAHPDSIEYLTGRRSWPTEPDAQWELLKNPLPLPAEHGVFRELRSARRIAPAEVRGPRFESLPASLRSTITRNFRDLVERSNPIFRRVVRRSRRMLEDSGLLKRIVVAIHPSQADELPPDLFAGQGLSMGFSDIFAVLGQLPDSFEDAWVDAVLKDREAVRYFPQRVEMISSPMEKRYWNEVADDAGLDWEFTEKVLSSHDIEAHMRQSW
jgi:hypothetical protein